MLTDHLIGNLLSNSQNGFIEVIDKVAKPLTLNNIKSVAKSILNFDLLKNGDIHSVLDTQLFDFDSNSMPRSKLFKYWLAYIDKNKIGGCVKTYMCTHCKQGPVNFRSSDIIIHDIEPIDVSNKEGSIVITFNEATNDRRLELDKLLGNEIVDYYSTIHGFISEIKIAGETVDISGKSLEDLCEFLDLTNISIPFKQRVEIIDKLIANDVPSIQSSLCIFCNRSSEFNISMEEIESTILDFFVNEYKEIIDSEIFLTRSANIQNISHFAESSYLDFTLMNRTVMSQMEEELKAEDE